MAHSSFGKGWPSCSFPKKTINFGGFNIVVHAELAELIGLLGIITEQRGYNINPTSQQWSWGFACRAIAGTKTPSNHSWGTAVDINAPTNPRAADKKLHTNMPAWMVKLWEDHGFRWGGKYSWPDAMHYEFMGTVQDARTITTRLRNFLSGGQPGPPPVVLPKPPVGEIGVPTGWMNAAHPLVKQGDRNGTVGHLQAILGLAVDNIFGPKTKAKVIERQRKEGIPADGACGDQTWGYVHPSIKEGSKGPYVIEVQQSLKGLTPDGDFGTKTKNAVVAFQKRQGLTADGVVGNKTWERLCVS